MFKDLKRIYKSFKAGKKFDNKHDSVPIPPYSTPQNSVPENNSKGQDSLPPKDQKPSGQELGTAPLAANHFSQATKDQKEKPAPFFNRLYTAPYPKARFLILVQMNPANADDEHPVSSLNETIVNDDPNTPNETPLLSTNANWPQAVITTGSQSLKINDFVDGQYHLNANTTPDTESIGLDRLLENVATHNNFSSLIYAKLDKSNAISLAEFNKGNEYNIIDEDNNIYIELDDDALLFFTDEIAVFGGDGFSFFVLDNEALTLFENNTSNNSWVSLKSDQEHFILKKEDVLEDDVEIITLEEELSFDDNDQTTEIITVNYFSYKDTIIGMSFDLPSDFYERHGDIDLASLLA